MAKEKSQFNRNLLTVILLVYILTIAVFFYPVLASEPGMTGWWMIPLNIIIISIPLVLVFGSIYILISAWHERSVAGKVSPRLAKIIHRAPRVASIMIIFFISLFSLDVFEANASPLEILGGFLMHNIPSIVLILLLLFVWKRPAVGFVVFLMAGVIFTVFFVREFSDLLNLLVFVLPILLIASLFYADWKWLKPSGS